MFTINLSTSHFSVQVKHIIPAREKLRGQYTEGLAGEQEDGLEEGAAPTHVVCVETITIYILLNNIFISPSLYIHISLSLSIYIYIHIHIYT